MDGGPLREELYCYVPYCVVGVIRPLASHAANPCTCVITHTALYCPFRTALYKLWRQLLHIHTSTHPPHLHFTHLPLPVLPGHLRRLESIKQASSPNLIHSTSPSARSSSPCLACAVVANLSTCAVPSAPSSASTSKIVRATLTIKIQCRLDLAQRSQSFNFSNVVSSCLRIPLWSDPPLSVCAGMHLMDYDATLKLISFTVVSILRNVLNSPPHLMRPSLAGLGRPKYIHIYIYSDLLPFFSSRIS